MRTRVRFANLWSSPGSLNDFSVSVLSFSWEAWDMLIPGDRTFLFEITVLNFAIVVERFPPINQGDE